MEWPAHLTIVGGGGVSNSASNAPMSEGSRFYPTLVSYGFWLLVCFLAFLYIIVTQHSIHL